VSNSRGFVVNTKIVKRRFLPYGIFNFLCSFLLVLVATNAAAEGSRTLFPSSYPATGFRADLDLSLDATPATLPYVGVTARRQFIYVYANAGEYILLGSSNRANGGDILVFNPQSFGTKGSETIPATADFTCSAVTPPVGSFSGGARGTIATRTNELAGPNSADNSATVANGYAPCAYLAPVSGIYGVRFTVATSGGSGPTGSVATLHVGNATVAAWEVQVRATATTTADINARAFTYSYVAFTGGNSRPVFHTLYYATLDGQRYQQTMQGFDPNGYALWANISGFLDNGQPLYKDIRGGNAQVQPGTGQFVAELSAQAPQFPIFFSTVDPTGPNAAEATTVLNALAIPLAPAAPTIDNPTFIGQQSGNQTYVGGGGTFTFTASNDTSYQIVISADGVDFDPANPANATLTGLAPNGSDTAAWDGNANNGTPFPVGTFTFQITGRNGEIHFPIVDDEGNANGGPTLTKLNGSPLGDHTVYFDDRGYVTSAGTPVGTLNGLLCPANPPVPPTPDHSLLGIDSNAQTLSGPDCNGGAGTCYYRYWPANGNANSDCAATAGFGDAKGLNLWSFQQSPVQSLTLVINAANITLVKSGPATVVLNTPFDYTIGLGNSGTGASSTTLTVSDVLPANVVANSVTPGPGVSSVNCGALPSTAGATLSCTVALNAALPGGSVNGTAAFVLNATVTSSTGSITNNASVDPTGSTNPPPPGASCTPAPSCGSVTSTVLLPPTIAKAFAPTVIALGGTTTLTFTVGNPNAGTALNGIAFSDSLPAGLSVAAVPNVVNGCGGAFTAVPAATMVDLSGVTLAASGTCTVSVDVVGLTSGVKNNTTGNVSSTNGGVGNTASASVTVLEPPAIAKAFNPATIAPGGTSTLTLTLSNPAANTVALVGVAFTDAFPAGLTVASPNGLANTCGGTATAAAGSGSVSLSGGTIAVGASCAITLTVTAAAPGSFVNTTGTVSSTNGGTGNTATATLNVNAAPQLTVVKTASPNPFTVGQAASYTITVTNTGGSPTSADITLTDTLPTGISLTGASGTGWTCSGTTALSCTYSGAALAPSASTVLTLNVSVAAGTANGNNSATASGGGDPACPAASNCTGVVTVPVATLAADLRILKTGPATATAGGTVNYTISVTNTGPDTATNAVVVDPAPAGLTYVSAGAPCSAGFPCNLGTLTSGQTVLIPNVVFTVAPSFSGTIVNVASVSSDQPDPTPNNNSSSVSTTVQGAPVAIAPTPGNASWAMLLLLLSLMGLGMSRMRSGRSG
jgi:uncharacterized repeat protein (TIGR01451 family)